MADKKLVINTAWCKGCNICVEFCPKGILSLEHGKVVVTDIEKCNYCTQCELRCPDFAIFIESGEEGANS